MSVATAHVPQHWSDRQRAVGDPSARSLLFTLLGEYVLPRDGAVWANSLVTSLAALGVEYKAARQAIARTSADGWLVRERAGKRVRCHLTDEARALLVTGAERIYSFGGSQDDWDGRWLLLLIDDALVTRDQRRRLQTRLGWAGLVQIRTGLWVGAHVDREREAADVLRELGITGVVSLDATAAAIGDGSALFASAWDLEALEDRYEAFVAGFTRIKPSSDEAMFVALTRLVHGWRQFPFLDPGLPAHLLPKRWCGDDARALFADRHEAWADGARRWFGTLEGPLTR